AGDRSPRLLRLLPPRRRAAGTQSGAAVNGAGDQDRRRRARPARVRAAGRGRGRARAARGRLHDRQPRLQSGGGNVRDAARDGRQRRGRDPTQHHRQTGARSAELSAKHRDEGRGFALDLLLTEQQRLFAETATRLARDHGGPKRLRALRAAGADMDDDAWRAVVKAGWLATVVAQPHGGQGLGAFDLALALEQAGRQLLMTPLLEAAAAAGAMSLAADDAGGPARLDYLISGFRPIRPAAAPGSPAGGRDAARR